MFKKVVIQFLIAISLLSFCVPTQQSNHDENVMEVRTQSVQDLGGLPDLYEASIAELQEGLERRAFTSVDLVKVRLSTHHDESRNNKFSSEIGIPRQNR